MDTKAYIEKMQSIQETFLEFIDSNKDLQDDSLIKDFNSFNYLKISFENISYHEKKSVFKEILLLISSICANHQRTATLNKKIETILCIFLEEMKKTLSNHEIFHIFRCNPNILLFLFKEQIIQIDEYISKRLQPFESYFSPEIISFYNGSQAEISQDIEEKRKKGNNDNYICNLIQNDLVEEFITYVTKTNFPLSGKIPQSKFETNLLLIEKNPSLIEYAAFCGAIQIFQYLRINGVILTGSLWIYAIHSRNPDLIHLLEEIHVEPNDATFSECLIESIKCYHNEIADYIKDNHLARNIDIFPNIIKYHNYSFFNENVKGHEYQLIQYGYSSIVKNLLNDFKDINAKVIFIITFIKFNNLVLLMEFFILKFLNQVSIYLIYVICDRYEISIIFY